MVFAFFVLAAGARAQTITCPRPTISGTPTEKQVLEKFYCDTGGADWTYKTNWGDAYIYDWVGVITQGEKVTHLDLYENNLTGTIPSELGSLTNLQYLDLYENNLTGTIPSELGSLTNLQNLNLDGNNLSGTIPAELGSLTNLQNLNLDGNNLSGTIPRELGSLANLQELILKGNDLSGTIPAELGNLSMLLRLWLQENQLTGTIPSELGNLNNLQYLILNGNDLSGTIPTQLGNLSMLLQLWLQENQLTDTIPSELGSLNNLQDLLLSGNQLSGGIPDLGSLTSLEELDLGGNELINGTIPDLRSLGSLTDLRLQNNQLSGGVPVSSNLPPNLRILLLNGNVLTGTIPSNLPTSLTHLFLGGNELINGTIPDLRSLSSLLWLYLDGNGLSGSIIPTHLPTNLQRLYLNGNGLTGTIPDLSGRLSSLQRLYLHGNQLSGGIPTELGSLSSLAELSLWSNPDLEQPTGSIRSKTDKAALRFIYLENNGEKWKRRSRWSSFDNDRTESAVTDDWSGLTVNDDDHVTAFILSNNNLTGDMSEAFTGLLSLEILYLSYNRDLMGELPAGLMNIENLSILNLCGTGVTIPEDTDLKDWLTGLGNNYNPPECSTQPPPIIQPTNNAPTADAGVDITVNAEQRVTLDGSGSSDPDDGDTLTYIWTQISPEPTENLEGSQTAMASFTAPSGPVTLVFELRVSDGTLSATDSVTVTVRGRGPIIEQPDPDPDPNRRPTANAGEDMTVNAEQRVILDGSGSRDPDDGDTLTYRWTQISGTRVTSTLQQNPRTGEASFTAPSGPATLVFELRVIDDKGLDDTDLVTVTVRGRGPITEPPPSTIRLSTPSSPSSQPSTSSNNTPIASAGENKTVEAGETVTLNGSGRDPDGDDLMYIWTQISGTRVTLQGSETAMASFTAPSGPATLVFELRVSDGTLSDTDSVIVIVREQETITEMEEEPEIVKEGGGGCSVAFIESGRSGLSGMALNLLLIISVLLIVRKRNASI